MSMNVGRELARLKKMYPSELREQYAEVFGEASRSGNKDFLVKRIIWRMQSLEQGGLSERARARARELARDADLRLRPPAHQNGDDECMSATSSLQHDLRLPMRAHCSPANTRAARSTCGCWRRASNTRARCTALSRR